MSVLVIGLVVTVTVSTLVYGLACDRGYRVPPPPVREPSLDESWAYWCAHLPETASDRRLW